jgi:hypothetical protein
MSAFIRKFARLEVPPLLTSGFDIHPFMMDMFAKAQWDDARNFNETPVKPTRGPYMHMTTGCESKYWKELENVNHSLRHFMKPFKVDAFGTKNIKDTSKMLMVRSWFRETSAGLDVTFFMERIGETEIMPGGYMPTSTDWNIMGQVDGWIQTSALDKDSYDRMRVVSFKPATAAELV